MGYKDFSEFFLMQYFHIHMDLIAANLLARTLKRPFLMKLNLRNMVHLQSLFCVKILLKNELE